MHGSYNTNAMWLDAHTPARHVAQVKSIRLLIGCGFSYLSVVGGWMFQLGDPCVPAHAQRCYSCLALDRGSLGVH